MLTAIFCDVLGCTEPEAARLTERMRAADYALVPASLVREIRRFADPQGTAKAAVQAALGSIGTGSPAEARAQLADLLGMNPDDLDGIADDLPKGVQA
jgi:hypothetical protein